MQKFLYKFIMLSKWTLINYFCIISQHHLSNILQTGASTIAVPELWFRKITKCPTSLLMIGSMNLNYQYKQTEVSAVLENDLPPHQNTCTNAYRNWNSIKNVARAADKGVYICMSKCLYMRTYWTPLLCLLGWWGKFRGRRIRPNPALITTNQFHLECCELSHQKSQSCGLFSEQWVTGSQV